MQLVKGTEWMLGSDSWIQILPQPLTSCVTSGKAFLKLFLHLPRDMTTPVPLDWGVRIVIHTAEYKRVLC